MIRALFLTARVLLAIAWLLLLICMFIPQARYAYYETRPELVTGMWVTVFALVLTLFWILTFLTSHLVYDALAVISFAVVLNVLLFITSPLALIKLKAGNLTYKSVYWVLNVVCLILFVPAIPQILAPPDTQNLMLVIQLLPNFFLWIAAHVALTLSASARLLGEVIATRQKVAV